MIKFVNLYLVLLILGSSTFVYGQKSEQLSEIIHQSQDLNPEGYYKTVFETDNGISAQEQGQIKGIGNKTGIATEGQFTYTSPEGEKISISYTADENGYRPSGNLPVPPPIPEYILRALQYTADHPQKEEDGERRPKNKLN